MDQEMKAYLDEQIASLKEEVKVLVEGLRGEVRLIGRGVLGVIERQDAPQGAMSQSLLEDVKASIGPAYRDLDRRVQWLEARAQRQMNDVFEAIRKTFGLARGSNPWLP